MNFSSGICSSPLFFKIMRIGIIFNIVLTTCMNLYAGNSHGQRISDTKVKIALQNESLVDAIKKIEGKSPFRFVFEKSDVLPINGLYLIESSRTVEDLLSEILKNKSISFRQVEKKILLSKDNRQVLPVVVGTPQQVISGTVVDTAGLAIPGVNVRVMGKNEIAITDAKGQFRIANIEAGDRLLFHMIGYAERIVSASQSMRVVLQTKQGLIEEVYVNTGYQRLPKERSAGSFAQPDMELFSQRTGSMNVLQRLDGLVPGLTVNNASGTDQFQIRGASSVGVYSRTTVGGYGGTDRSPLVVVDGVPVNSINDVNPQDVESVTVLKDATASSIWGARASNGVIVITTKRGTASGRLQVDYSMFFNFMGKPNMSYFPVLNSKQFIMAAEEIFNPAIMNWQTISNPIYSLSEGVAPHEQLLYDYYERKLITESQMRLGLDSLAGLDNRQQLMDLFYRNASLSNHTLSLCGGQDKYRFYGSLAFTDDRNNQPDNKNRAYKINLRQDYKPHERVNLYLVTDLTNKRTESKPILPTNAYFLPYQLFADQGGNPIAMPWLYRIPTLQQDYERRSGVSLNYVPLQEGEFGLNNSNYLAARINSGLSVKIVEGLNFEGTYGWNHGITTSEAYLDQQSYTMRNLVASFATGSKADNTIKYYIPFNGGRMISGTAVQSSWTVRNQLSFNRGWQDNVHQVAALLGMEQSENKSTNNTGTMWGYNDQMLNGVGLDYTSLSAGIPNTIMRYNSFYSTWGYGNDFYLSEIVSRFRSVYANAAYTFKNRYTVNGSWRKDESSLFGIDKSSQNRPVWSVGGRYDIGKEEFMSGPSWINQLAVRATYGVTGSAPSPGTAASKDIIASEFPRTNLPYGVYNISVPANRGLTWEATRTVNLGLDFALLNNRISGSLDVYRRRTSDLLGNRPANPFSGYTTIVGNLGNLENKGVEMSLRGVPVRLQDFEWSVALNAAYNKNKITKLSTSLLNATGNAIIDNNAYGGFFEGYAAYALFAYRYAGLDESGDPQIYLSDGTVTKALNVAKPEDMQFMGTYQPKWSGGLTNSFQYKGFGLNVNIIGNLGHVMRRDVNTKYTETRLAPGGGSISSGNVHADFANRWKEAGDEDTTDIPRWVGNSNTSTTQRYVRYYIYADRNVVDASFIKLRDITLSYALPQQILQKVRFSTMSVQLQMGNIMLWKANEFDIDPEYFAPLTGTRTLLRGQHTFSIGTNITF